MKLQYIKAPLTGQKGKFLMPATLTRFYYRKNFQSQKGKRYCLTVRYPFAFEVFINGEQATAEDCAFSFVGDGGECRIGIKTYLSDDPMRFLPVLSGELSCDGLIVLRIDESWRSFTFAAFYTEKEDADWAVKEYPHAYARCYENSPEEILRAHYFKKCFVLDAEPMTATVRATARGLYRLYVNGADVAANVVLSPGVVSAPVLGAPHSSAKCDLYQEYDVAPFLKKGKNVIALESGNGWYASEGFNTIRVAQNEVAAELIVRTKEGDTVIATDESWSCAPSPCVQNDLQWGERYDARLEIAGWNFDADTRGWLPCERTQTAVPLQKQSFPQIEIAETLRPVRVFLSQGGWICDFGENLSGRVCLTLRGVEAGSLVIVRYAEKLLQNGELCGGPYHDVYFAKDTHWGGIAGFGARNIDAYIANGKAEQTFAPDCAFTGFRYVEIRGVPREKCAVSARRMRTAAQRALDFSCDNELFDGIFRCARNSIESNLFCGPMDCPTREKNYWNGDIAMDAVSVLHAVNGKDLFAYWTAKGRKIDSDAFAWRDELYLVPYALYLVYGEKNSLRENFEKICALADERLRLSENGRFPEDAVTFFGDYAQPSEYPPVRKEIFTQLWFYRCISCTAEICEILGEEKLAGVYRQASLSVRARFEKDLLPQVLSDCSANIGEVILTAAFGIIDEDTKRALVEHLEERLIRDDYAMSCGACSCGFLLPLLTECGKLETAWNVAVRRAYPSYGYMVESGATTLTEYWGGMNSSDEGDSLDHHFKSGVLQWLIGYVAGLQGSAGYENILIEPKFINKVKRLAFTYESARGKISVRWKTVGNILSFRVLTPVSGRLIVSGRAYPLQIGENTFELKISQ